MITEQGCTDKNCEIKLTYNLPDGCCYEYKNEKSECEAKVGIYE